LTILEARVADEEPSARQGLLDAIATLKSNATPGTEVGAR